MWRTAAVLAITVALGCGGKKFDPSEAAHVEASAIVVGAPAPDAKLTSASATQVALADVFRAHSKTVVVFYRGFF